VRNKYNLFYNSSLEYTRTISVPLDSAWLLQFEPQFTCPGRVSQSVRVFSGLCLLLENS